MYKHPLVSFERCHTPARHCTQWYPSASCRIIKPRQTLNINQLCSDRCCYLHQQPLQCHLSCLWSQHPGAAFCTPGCNPPKLECVGSPSDTHWTNQLPDVHPGVYQRLLRQGALTLNKLLLLFTQKRTRIPGSLKAVWGERAFTLRKSRVTPMPVFQ